MYSSHNLEEASNQDGYFFFSWILLWSNQDTKTTEDVDLKKRLGRKAGIDKWSDSRQLNENQVYDQEKKLFQSLGRLHGR